MTWEFATRIMAVWGALTGTIAIAMELWSYWRAKPRVTVELLRGFVMMSPTPGVNGVRYRQDDNETYCRLIVRNLGKDAIRIESAYFALGGEKPMFLSFPFDFPPNRNKVLDPQNPTTEFMAKERGIDFDRVIYVAVTDGWGKNHLKYLMKGSQKRRELRAFKATLK